LLRVGWHIFSEGIAIVRVFEEELLVVAPRGGELAARAFGGEVVPRIINCPNSFFE